MDEIQKIYKISVNFKEIVVEELIVENIIDDKEFIINDGYQSKYKIHLDHQKLGEILSEKCNDVEKFNNSYVFTLQQLNIEMLKRDCLKHYRKRIKKEIKHLKKIISNLDELKCKNTTIDDKNKLKG